MSEQHIKEKFDFAANEPETKQQNIAVESEQISNKQGQ